MSRRPPPIEPWEAVDSYGSRVGHKMIKGKSCECDEPSISRIATNTYEYCINCSGILKIKEPF